MHLSVPEQYRDDLARTLLRVCSRKNIALWLESLKPEEYREDMRQRLNNAREQMRIPEGQPRLPKPETA